MTKYLLYAVGEILLVVIGILIALQVNNWNEERQEREEEKQILINLKGDFEKAAEQLEYLNGLRNNVLSSFDELIKISNSESFVEPAIVDSIILETLYVPTFNDPTGSLTTLLSSDKINLLSNNDLKTQLMSWPSQSKDMTEDETREVGFFDTVYRPFLLEHLSASELLDGYDISDIDFKRQSIKLEGIKKSKHVRSDYESLLRNPGFINSMHWRAVFLNLSRHETNQLLERANSTLRIIEDELTN